MSNRGVSINYSFTTADEDKVNYAIGCMVNATSQGKTSCDVAEYIQDQFDKKYGNSWHCLVGDTGAYASHTECETGCRIRFTMGDEDIHLFKHRTTTEPKPSPRHYPHISPSDRKLIYKSKMDAEMEYHVFDCCKRACEWYTSNAERAKFIKEEFDKEHNRGWNCWVGSAASFVHQRHNCYIAIDNFGKDNVRITLWRC